MVKAVIQHFKRANAFAAEKTLVSEKIEEGSATARFLERMEAVRKSKVCNYLVDMRGKAPGQIRQHKFQGRIFYMDDCSLSIFKQGLKDNNNAFTIGTYEAITEGEHTFKFQRRQQEQLKNGRSSIPEHSHNQNTKEYRLRKLLEVEGKYTPEIIPLGYFLRRNEPRLMYRMPIKMIYDGVTYDVKTKDFSLNGLQTFMDQMPIEVGRTVLISFSKFIEEARSVVGGISPMVFKEVEYQIKNVLHKDGITYISMAQVDLSEEAKQYFTNFMESNRSRYKFDATDTLHASEAKVCEHVYTHNTLHVPVFVTWNKENGFKVGAVIKSSKNHCFFDFIAQDNQQKELSNIFLPHRITKLANLARNGQGALLYLYRQDGKLHSGFDFEYSSVKDLAELATRTKSYSGKVFKITNNLSKKPHKEKMEAMLKALYNLDPSQSELIRKRVKETIAQIILTDITRTFFQNNIFTELLDFNLGDSSNVLVWRNNNQVRLSDGSTVKVIHKNELDVPKIVELKVVQHRLNERYQYKMDIKVYSLNQIYSAHTIDFSSNGLGIKIADKNFQCEKNTILKISFTSLMSRKVNVDLSQVPYKVAVTNYTSDGLFIGLERCADKNDATINAFFNDLIQRNKEKLNLCVKDRVERMNMTFYEAYVTENIQTIPIIINGEKEENQFVQQVGLTEVSCDLAEIFYRRDFGYDFGLLTSQIRLDQFLRRASEASREDTQSFMLFLYKEIDKSSDDQYIVSVADFEIRNKDKVNMLIDKTMDMGGSIVKIQFVNNLVTDELLKNKLVDDVMQLNKMAGVRFSRKLEKIIGFADMVDVTQEFKFRQQIYKQLN